MAFLLTDFALSIALLNDGGLDLAVFGESSPWMLLKDEEDRLVSGKFEMNRVRGEVNGRGGG
jgi:hypothetical protein